MTARQRWKVWYRKYRIIRRESAKASIDMILFGTGFVMIVPEPDFVRHVPIQQIIIKS